MLAAIDYSGIAQLVTSIGGVVLAGVAAYRAGKAAHGVDTLNELTSGQLAARQETRRIEQIAEADRTPQESRHLRES